MTKLSREQISQLYNERKNENTEKHLSKKYNIRKDRVNYLVSLIDYHGIDIIRNGKNRKYTSDMKTKIMNEVLIDNNFLNSTAVKYGLSSRGWNWIFKKLRAVVQAERSECQKKVSVILELQPKYPLKVFLKVSGISRSTYYYHVSKEDKDNKNVEIMNLIIDIYYTHRQRYGYHISSFFI